MYVKRVERNRIANILSIEKYLDGCVKILSLGRFFFFFFCNHAFIVFRYKKPHAAVAMERTKPINQNK